MISEREILNLLTKHYDLNADHIHTLVGYDNPNYKIEAGGQCYVLKLYEEDRRFRQIIETENSVLCQIQERLTGKIPNPIATTAGNTIFDFSTGRFGRLLSYLDGDLMEQVEHSPALFRSLGKLLGSIDKALSSIDIKAVHKRKTDWDIQHAIHIKKFLKYIPPSRRKLPLYFIQQFEEFVLPKLDLCRKGLIHGDANDLNIVCNENQVTGIFDFGDMVYSSIINDLAICLAYALMKKDEPISWARFVVSAFHQEYPLSENELDILYYLIATRLCVSVCHSAYKRTLEPDNDYLFVSEEKAWRLMEQWIGVSPVGFANELKNSLGFETGEEKERNARIRKRSHLFSKNLSLSYEKPIEMKSAAFQYMYDVNGTCYLDTCNNIPHVGHCHPGITEVAQKHFKILNTNTRYIYQELDEYAERLGNTLPASLSKTFLVNSGSAATDLALRMVHTIRPGKKIVVMEQGYHGNTFLGIGVSAYKYEGKGGKGKPVDVIQLKLPALYDLEQQQKDIEEAIHLIQSNRGEIAALITESILGCAGQYPLPTNFMQKICHEVRKNGGFIIADEVQTGFGRVGQTFWAFQLNGIIPDMVILGKPIANGHPMGALVTTEQIANEFDNGMEFFSSFGGNPISCAIANKVLEIISEEDLQKNAKKIGNHLKQKLLAFKESYPFIYDVRGEGLFLGIELRKNQIANEQDGEITKMIVEQFKANNILVSSDGKFRNTLKIKPPMCFTISNANQFLKTLENILDNLTV